MTEQTLQGTASKLARWISDFQVGSIPSPVLHHAKALCLDSIACLIAGVNTHPCAVIRDVLVLDQGAAEGVLLPGSDLKTGVLAASYLGAHAANILDFDDSFRAGAPSHPGATVVPPALAVAQKQNASGADLLVAVVLGYEVSLRIGRAIQPTPKRKLEVMGFSSWQTFGAMAASASLLKLREIEVLNAFGLAGAQAPVPSVRKMIEGDPPFTWAKNCYGIASHVGVMSALLAQRGFVGNREILDGASGFWVMAGSDQYRRELATEDMGSKWLSLDVGFKSYGCCRWAHTLLDALQSLAPKLSDQAVERVDVYGFVDLAKSLNNPLPASIVDAQFNARYLAALELLGRSPSLGLSDSDLTNPDVIEMAKRVWLHHDADADKDYFDKGMLPVRVCVTCKSGVALTAAASWASGSSEAGGLPDTVLSDKFLSLAVPVLGRSKAEDALEAIWGLETRSIRDLANLLSTSQR